MTEHVGFLEQLPVRAVLDGELVAFGDDGKPDFERVCERMLFRRDEVPLTFVAFDVLSLEGEDLRQEPYRERRQILEAPPREPHARPVDALGVRARLGA